MDKEKILKIWQKIEHYQRIIIHHHIMKDYDALGSSFGLQGLILSAWPNKEVYVVGSDDPKLALVPSCDILSSSMWKDSLVIVCDCSNTVRIDGEHWHLADFVIKIDHHEDFQPFGDLSWVNTNYVATAEMIVAMYEHAYLCYPLYLSKQTRQYLYYGIMTDTHRFHFVHASQAGPLMKRVALLLEAGDISPFDMTNQVYRYSESEIRIDGFIKQHYLRPIPELAYIKVPHDILEKYQWDFLDVRGKVNSMMGIIGVRVWALLIENEKENNIHVELRSSEPTINTLALKYGGGGHRLASGCKLSDWSIAEQFIEDLKAVAIE